MKFCTQHVPAVSVMNFSRSFGVHISTASSPFLSRGMLMLERPYNQDRLKIT